MDNPRRDDQSLEGLSDEVLRFVERVPDAYSVEPGPDVESRHLAAIGEQVRALGPDALVAGRGSVVRTPFTRSRAMLGSFLATLIGKIALGTAAAVAATGGLAATGNLPAPAQEVAVSAAVRVGVHLPDPKKDDAKSSEGRQDGEHKAKQDDGRGRSPKPSEGARRGADKFELRGVVESVRGGAPANTDDGTTGSGDRKAPAPGAMRVTVKGTSQSGDACGVKPGGTASVRWTEGTRFSPPSVVDDPAFPSNLTGARVQAGGAIVRETGGGCVLVASHVEVMQGGDGSPRPLKSPETGRPPKDEGTERPGIDGPKSPDPNWTPKPVRTFEPKDDRPDGAGRPADGGKPESPGSRP